MLLALAFNRAKLDFEQGQRENDRGEGKSPFADIAARYDHVPNSGGG